MRRIYHSPEVTSMSESGKNHPESPTCYLQWSTGNVRARWLGAFFMLFFILAGQSVMAQVANYGLVSTTQTYVPLSTFTSVNATGAPFGGTSDDGYLQVALPFTFTYNGTGYTTVTMSTNGWLAMGASTQVNANSFDPANMFTNTNPNNIVSGYMRDGNANFGSGGSFRHGAGGTGIYVLEWNQVSGNGSSTSATIFMSYQIRLYGPASATPGRIEISYGPSSGSISTSAGIGIHGTGTDYYNAVSGNTSQTTLASAYPAANTLYRFTTPVPCLEPTAQPTAMVFGTTTATAIAGSFTAASPVPSKYMIVRSTSATPPTPVDGTAYANGSTTLGAGTSVIQSSSSLSFSDSGLTAGTTYYYYAYSFNDGCSGAPNYLASSPLAGSKATLCATGTSVGSNTITAGGANITWTGAGNYIVEYGATGFTPGTGAIAGAGGTIASSAATSPYALSGLSSSTVYQVYVRQVCPLGGYSANSSAHSFTTACAPITTFPSTQVFAAYPPTCWTEGNNGSLAAGPATVSTTAASGWTTDGWLNSGSTGAAAYNIFSSNSNQWMISSYYTLPAGMRLTYKVAALQFGTANALTDAWEADDFVQLLVSADMLNWTVLKTYNSSNVPSHLGQLETVDLSSMGGQTVHFAFRTVEGASNGNADIDFMIDDFTVELIPVLPPNCATGLVPADAATNISRTPTLSWTAATGSATSYDIYFGTSPTPGFVANVAGLAYTPAILNPNTVYYWKVVPKNANGDASGCAVQSFTTGTSIDYCVSTYTSGCGTAGADAITNVTLGTLNNSSACAAAPYYTFYNAVTIPNIMQNATANVAVTMSTDGDQFAGVWIDYNQNGVFESSEGVVTTVDVGVSGSPSTASITLNIPADAVLGNTRMRVRGGNDSAILASEACGITSGSNWGETEDYIVNVIAMPTDAPDYVNLQYPANATVLAGETTTVYARVYEGGLTNVTSGQASGIEAWIGISPMGSNTNPNTWTTWIPATFNVETDGGNNDEYQANIGQTVAGTYYYASRFRLNGGPYVYGGHPFNQWDGTTSVSGVLTVDPNPTQCADIAAPANAATGVTIGTVALTWTAPGSGPAPTAYDVYFGTTPGSIPLLAANVTGLTTSATAPAYATTYYWKVVPKSTIGGTAAGCSEWSFTTQPNPFDPYCSDVTYIEDVEPITLVKFAGINNATSNTINGTPEIENFISITGNVTTESTYAMTLKGNTGGNFTSNFSVFIDWNQDGDFGDAGETIPAGSVTNTNGNNATHALTNIVIPGNALAGTTRMRIKKLYSGDDGDVADPCDGGEYGQTEDYSLNITLCTPTIWYADSDGDGFGNAAASQSACHAPVGYVANNTDCNDADNAVYQSANLYIDTDGDGYDAGQQIVCYGAAIPAGYSMTTNGSDCNDGNAAMWQSALLYADADTDGYDAGQQTICYGASIPAGYATTTNGSDCNDNDAARHATYPFYADNDGDTYGAGIIVTLCAVNAATPPSAGYSVNDLDCDDTKNSVHPGATEIGYNLIDDDCDGSIDEGFPPKATVIQSLQCNTTLAAIDTQLTANLVAGAQGYRWRITTMSGPDNGQVQFLDTPLRAMKLTQLVNYAFNTQYKVEVGVYYAGYLQPFTASACTVTTPAAMTALASCGQTLTNLSDVIYTNLVPYATGYRFRITDPINAANTQVIDRSVREIRMNLVTAFAVRYGKTYNVEVAVRNTDGTYMPYGTVCPVTTPIFPTTSLQDSQCDDYNVPTSSTPIYAFSYPGAVAYAFQLTGPGLPETGIEIVKPIRTFVLGDFSGLVPGGTYNVKVRLIFNLNDPAGPYGKTCTIIAPGLSKQTVKPENIFNVTAFPNPFADNFSIDVITSLDRDVNVKVYDMTGRLLETKEVKISGIASLQVGDRYPSGVYNVVVTQGEHVKTLRVVKR